MTISSLVDHLPAESRITIYVPAALIEYVVAAAEAAWTITLSFFQVNVLFVPVGIPEFNIIVPTPHNDLSVPKLGTGC